MKTLINRLLSGFRSSGKKKDPTSEFREYMFGRERRRERREHILFGALVFVAAALVAFILCADMLGEW